MKLYAVVLASTVLVSCGKKDMNGGEEQAPQTPDNSEIIGDGSEVVVDPTNPVSGEEGNTSGENGSETNPENENPNAENPGNVGPKKCTTLTFDNDEPNKDPFKAGVEITNQFEGIRFSFKANDVGLRHGILFDSQDPNQEESNDFDLVIDPADRADGKGLGNILILAENDEMSNGIFTNPDDNATGGYMKLYFDKRVVFESITMIDMDEDGNFIRLYDKVDGQYDLVSETDVPMTENGGTVDIAFGLEDGPSKKEIVGSKMKIILGASGAVDNIKFCEVQDSENPSQAK